MDERRPQSSEAERREIIGESFSASRQLEDGRLMRFVKRVGAPVTLAAGLVLGGAAACNTNPDANDPLEGGIPETVPENSETFPFAFIGAATDLNYGAFSIMYTLPQSLPSGQPISNMPGTIHFVYDGSGETTAPESYTFSKGSHVIPGEEIDGVQQGRIPSMAVIEVTVDGETKTTEVPICGEWCEQSQ